MKKRKEEVLRNKEQSSVQPTEQSIEQSTVQSTEHRSVQSTVQSIYVYGIGILAIFAISICVFLDVTLSNLKKSSMKNDINHQNDVICFKKIL